MKKKPRKTKEIVPSFEFDGKHTVFTGDIDYIVWLAEVFQASGSDGKFQFKVFSK